LAGIWLDGAGPPLTGRAAVTDGDTLRLGGQRVRLTGLDAPELDQTCVDAGGKEWPCGTRARQFLADLLKTGEVTCQRSGRDAYRRVLATCMMDSEDIGAKIVATGWAVADFRYGAEEAQARTAGRGIWTGSFVLPAEWRRSRGPAAPGLLEWIRSWFQ
jgi:endonuclease YncB( thermonuclease family)